MAQPNNAILVDALDRYFAAYASTRELAAEFIAKRRHPVEILILLCARLDALASDAAKDGTSSRKAFTGFVTAYGGQRDLLGSVSIADLYYELSFHRWLLDGTIPKPGRLRVFSNVDEPIVHLLEDADLPLTLQNFWKASRHSHARLQAAVSGRSWPTFEQKTLRKTSGSSKRNCERFEEH